jgi:hypothetical protein
LTSVPSSRNPSATSAFGTAPSRWHLPARLLTVRRGLALANPAPTWTPCPTTKTSSPTEAEPPARLFFTPTLPAMRRWGLSRCGTASRLFGGFAPTGCPQSVPTDAPSAEAAKRIENRTWRSARAG